MSIYLVKIRESETGLIAGLADKIWHAYYIDFIRLEQIDYMLDRFYSRSSLEGQLKEGQEFYFIMDGEKTVGFVSISQKSQAEYFIHKFYILPEQHGRNTGSKVMNLLLEITGSRNVIKDINIRLTVNRQNYKAINFYFKNGFTIEKAEDFDIGNGFFMNDFVMLLKIRA